MEVTARGRARWTGGGCTRRRMDCSHYIFK